MEHHIKQCDHTGQRHAHLHFNRCCVCLIFDVLIVVRPTHQGRQQSTDRKQWPRTAEETYHQRRTYKQQTQQDRDALAEAVKVARTCNAFTFTAHCRSRSRSRSRSLAVFMMMLCVVRPWAMVGCL
jgi:hypothetical protein